MLKILKNYNLLHDITIKQTILNGIKFYFFRLTKQQQKWRTWCPWWSCLLYWLQSIHQKLRGFVTVQLVVTIQLLIANLLVMPIVLMDAMQLEHVPKQHLSCAQILPKKSNVLAPNWLQSSCFFLDFQYSGKQ